MSENDRSFHGRSLERIAGVLDQFLFFCCLNICTIILQSQELIFHTCCSHPGIYRGTSWIKGCFKAGFPEPRMLPLTPPTVGVFRGFVSRWNVKQPEEAELLHFYSNECFPTSCSELGGTQRGLFFYDQGSVDK